MSVKQIVSAAVAIIIFKVMEDGRVLLAAMEYTKKGHSSIRVPVGTTEPGENFLQALHRETVEEVAKDPENFGFRSLNGDLPIWGMFAPDEKNPEGSHFKAVYAVSVTCGELRDKEMMDGDELLGPLSFVELQDLWKQMTSAPGHSVYFHRLAVAKVLSILAREPEIYSRYHPLLAKMREENRIEIPTDLSSAEREEVARFAASQAA